MFRTKNAFFIALLLVVTLLNSIDFYNDMQEDDHSRLHLALEALVILVSLAGISYLIREIQQRRREIDMLSGQLKSTRADLSATRENLDEARASLSELDNKRLQASRQYGKVVQEQLEAWGLTPSEQEVALLLLKGLSFEEIANVRDTKEKTVRQQATAIYRKSGLNGRHEFAAWFFEDFLQ